ncbi:Glycosyl hydrolases family 25 [Lachnospiraceae bacterium A10]|nr:Glycosyl hydrolases family 25 [Lachnospiraceae bacterium A10]
MREKNKFTQWIRHALLLMAVYFVCTHTSTVKAMEYDPNDGQAGREEIAEQWALENTEEDDTSIVMNDPRNSTNVRRCGIDVSKYQGNIDWSAVRNSGVEFAYIRVGYRGHSDGVLREDPYFRQNLQNATACGIKVGVYIYSEAISDAEAYEEADFLADRVSGYNVELPLVIDYEFCSGSMAAGCRLINCNQDMATRTQVCKAFCARARQRGYEGCVYANKSTLTNIINGNDIACNGYKIWVAQYPYENCEAKLAYSNYSCWRTTSYSGIYDFWQFTSSGTSVAGIGSPTVDLDFWYDDGTIQGITGTSIFELSKDSRHITCGLVVNGASKSNLEYRWVGYSYIDQGYFTISDWTAGNEWLSWNPNRYGNLLIIGQVRNANYRDQVYQSVVTMQSSPHIKGKCQMPNPGGGYLIGFESYDNPNQSYQYEMLIYDCTLKTWVYTTGRCNVPQNNFWTVWKPQYGYYWTLFRIYDSNGNCIDEQCYGFQNIC